jgi:putative transposase
MVRKMTNAVSRPPHLFLDETWYFITAHGYQNKSILESIEAKVDFWEKLFPLAKAFEINLTAWVILDNHYHLLCYLKKSENITHFYSSSAWGIILIH